METHQDAERELAQAIYSLFARQINRLFAIAARIDLPRHPCIRPACDVALPCGDTDRLRLVE